MYTVLVCDDEPDIVSALKINLTAENYRVLAASNGAEALEVLEREHADIILMDVMMPVMDGVAAVIRLREKSNVPVIFLTAKSEDEDIILGLNIGADDYITKPFRQAEVSARIRSHLRRYMSLGGAEKTPDELSVGGIVLNDAAKRVTLDGAEIPLTPYEYRLLLFLMEHPGQVFSSEELYRNVWRDTPYGGENTVAVHIRHLREKLEINPSEPRYLKVVWGHGYKIEEVK